jgi:hypothetical protein
VNPEEFVSPEVGLAVAATTVILHPKVRATARQGLVYGLAGGLSAWAAVKQFASGFNGAPLGAAASGAAHKVGGTLHDIEQEAQEVAHKGEGNGRSVVRKGKAAGAAAGAP